jgi:uncharacterized membrane protein required for colicin V production
MALAPIDYVVLAIFALALLRGVIRGLLRETFSVASLGAACLAVLLFGAQGADWLLRVTDGRIGEIAAPWAAGALIALLAIGATTLTGRVLRRGAKAAGLGWFDRAGGAAIGAAEGLLLAGILLSGTEYVLGGAHPVLSESRSYQALGEFEQLASGGEWPQGWPQVDLPEVAAGPSRRAVEQARDE